MAKTALVTGASAGIGAEFARELARDGFDLVLVARRAERLEALASELGTTHGITAIALPDDLGDPAAPARIHAELQRRDIHIDMLVNNAGSGIAQTFTRAKWQVHAQLIQVQVTAAAQLTHLFLPAMLARSYGRIINVASLAGLMPGAPTSTLYPAAKSFLVKFSESLAAELWGSGVHVCAVCPGFTFSEFHDVMGTRSAMSKMPKFMWQDAPSVARAGIAAVMRNETVYVTGPVNQLLAHAVRVLSPNLARTLMRRQAKRYRSVPSVLERA
ncbi:MAG: SDR family oxidoreductase [Polyangiales bacterium]